MSVIFLELFIFRIVGVPAGEILITMVLREQQRVNTNFRGRTFALGFFFFFQSKVILFSTDWDVLGFVLLLEL